MSNNTPKQTAPGWRRLPIVLSILVSDSGLVALCADQPRNLSVAGRSLLEAMESLVQFAKDCEELGKPFAVLHGVKLQ